MRWWMFREFPVSLSFPPTSTVCHPLRPDFSWQSVLIPNTVNNRKERLSPTHLRFPDVPPYYSQAFIYILPDTNYTVLLSTKSQHMKLLMALPIWLAILVSILLLHGPISLQLQKSVIPFWFFCQTFLGQWPGYIRRWTGNMTGKFPSGFDFCRWVQELPWRTGLLSLPGHLPLLLRILGSLTCSYLFLPQLQLKAEIAQIVWLRLLWADWPRSQLLKLYYLFTYILIFHILFKPELIA